MCSTREQQRRLQKLLDVARALQHPPPCSDPPPVVLEMLCGLRVSCKALYDIISDDFIHDRQAIQEAAAGAVSQAAAAPGSAAATNTAHLSTIQLHVLHDREEAVYNPVRLLGKGGEAEAWLVQLQQPHPTLPSQAVLKLARWDVPMLYVSREAENMYQLEDHPNAVQIYTVWQGDTSWCPGAHNPGYGILLEYCPYGTSLSYFNQQLDTFKTLLQAASQAAPGSMQAEQEAGGNLTLDQAVQRHLAAKARDTDVAALSAASARAKEAVAAVLQQQQRQPGHHLDAEGYLAAAADAPYRVFALEVPLRTHMWVLMCCMSHLHNNGRATRSEAVILHHDIKPQHILIGGDGTPKFADWGMASICFLTQSTQERPTMTGATPRYAAPEVLTGVKADPTTTLAKSDLWSAMLSWLHLLTGLRPFFWMKNPRSKLFALVRQDHAQARLEWLLDTYYTPLLPADTLAFFKWALKVDERERPDLFAVKSHDYTKGPVLHKN